MTLKIPREFCTIVLKDKTFFLPEKTVYVINNFTGNHQRHSKEKCRFCELSRPVIGLITGSDLEGCLHLVGRHPDTMSPSVK